MHKGTLIQDLFAAVERATKTSQQSRPKPADMNVPRGEADPRESDHPDRESLQPK
jgi:hypothetical protein